MKNFFYSIHFLRLCILTFSIGTCNTLSAQKAGNYRITYKTFFNNKPMTGSANALVFTNSKEMVLTSSSQNTPLEENVFDLQRNLHYTLFRAKNGKQASTIDSTNNNRINFELSSETRQIHGFTCRKATTYINSNKLEFWYTTDPGIVASPIPYGANLGFVLQYVRNGNLTILVDSIDTLQTAFQSRLADIASIPLLNQRDYADFQWRSRFTTVPVLKNARLNFSDETQSNDSLLVLRKGMIQIRKINFPPLKRGDKIFVDVTQKALGDAYDRTGTVFLIPDSKITTQNGHLLYTGENGRTSDQAIASGSYQPNIELMRFFTSFGAGMQKPTGYQLKGREWADQNFFRQDITEFTNLMNGKTIYVGIMIENYDRLGHLVDMNFTIHNGNPADSAASVVLPLWNSVDVLEPKGDELRNLFKNPKGLQTSFTLHKPLKHATLRFITTGHGGWENGDEFLEKTNMIYLDGKPFFPIIPRRVDCGSFRTQNPTSGNFSNGLSSSDLSRSNWCPGSVTNPYFIDLGNLKAGKHTIQLSIPQGPDEGGSYSQWNVSAVITGY